MASVEGEMKEGGSEGSDEDRYPRDWILGGFGLEEEERKSGQETKRESGEEGVKVGAVESEIGRGAEVAAEKVGVSDCTREDDRDCGGAGESRKGGALESERD